MAAVDPHPPLKPTNAITPPRTSATSAPAPTAKPVRESPGVFGYSSTMERLSVIDRAMGGPTAWFKLGDRYEP